MMIKAFVLVHNSVMDQLPSSIQVQEEGELRGGYSWVGDIGQWNAVLIVTTAARLDTVEVAAGNNALVLVRVSQAGGELDININGDALIKLNIWLTNRGFPTETNGSARQIIRRLFRRFLGRFELEQIDVN